MKKLFVALAVLFAGWLVARAWAARFPTPFPWFARAALYLPRPFVTRERVLDLLDPQPGERVLEIGPGSGRYTLPVARRLESGGALEVLDVERRFLDLTLRRAREADIANVTATQGDGSSLPYADATFDAAFLVSTLGEIADPEAALAELRRVLKPSGRLILGESSVDPDFPRLEWLVARAGTAGLRLEGKRGNPLGYVARFVPDPTRQPPPP
jgi:SAM-dependent methyltransferase